jgi:hypothetical protein
MGFKASADTPAEAVAFSAQARPLSGKFSVDDMKVMA